MTLTATLLPIIKEASKIMMSANNVDSESSVTNKTGDANFVTVYDKATQDFLIEKISKALPGAKFVAEEQENDYSILDGDYVFIIDPIDGTTNFIHGFCQSTISVACISHSKTVFGAERQTD